MQQNSYKTFPSSQENYLLEQFLHAGGAWLEPSFAASLEEEGEMQTKSWAESLSAILSVLWEKWPGAELPGLLWLLSCHRPSEKFWGAFRSSQVWITLSLSLVLCSLSEHHFEATVWEECQCFGSVWKFLQCSCPSCHFFTSNDHLLELGNSRSQDLQVSGETQKLSRES